MGRSGIEQYLYMMDQAFESSEGWHSLMQNLRDVREDEWDWVPEGAKRSIRQIARHCGARYMYANHMFGDRSMRWWTIPPPPNQDPASIIEWIREGFRQMRDGVASLADDAELTRPRGAPLGPIGWGNRPGEDGPDECETRWLISIMIQHDLYHAGEINHIRAMRQGNDD